MITVHNVKDIEGKSFTLKVPSNETITLDANHQLTALPALIDSHVHFRTPGAEHKEDWRTGAKAAIAGGVTTVIDMPNNTPSCITLERLHEKKQLIDAQLAEVNIPLRYALYLGADKEHFSEIPRCKQEVIGLKVFMGSSTGGLLMDDDVALEQAFTLAAQEGMLVAVHAEDETILKMKKEAYGEVSDPCLHSKIRHRSAAKTATHKAINLARKTGARLHVLHVGTKEEVSLIRQAKKEGVNLFAETTPHHLLLSSEAYSIWGTKVQVNPPIRNKEDQEALWEGIQDGTIDTIATDHAPHTEEEKAQPYGKAPSGVPGVQTFLPLLLDACHRGLLSLEDLVRCTRTAPQQLFGLEDNDDWVLVNLDEQHLVTDEHILSKCGWSPFTGSLLFGWPRYTLCQGQLFDLRKMREGVHA